MPSKKNIKPKKIGPDEAAKLIKALDSEMLKHVDFHAPDYEDETGKTTIHLYEGDLNLKPGYIGATPIIVTGNLTVDGFLFDGNNPASLTIVMGNLQARTIRTKGSMLVKGDLIVDEALYANSLNNFELWVGGNLKTPIFIEEGMRCHIRGDIISKHVVSLQNQITFSAGKKKIDKRKDAKGVLHPSLMDKSGYPNMDLVFEAMQEGQPLHP